MPWHLVERSNGQTLRGTYESRDEAEAFRAELVAEDSGYDDVLFIRWRMFLALGDRISHDAKFILGFG